MPHAFKQAAHLAIAAFADSDAYPAVGAIAAAIFNAQKLRHAVFKLHAIEQFLAIFRREFAQDTHCVFALQTKARMHQAVCQLP